MRNVCGKGCWCTHKAVHIQRIAHTRQFVATAGGLLFKGVTGAGPCDKRSEPRWCGGVRWGGGRCGGGVGGVGGGVGVVWGGDFVHTMPDV